MIRLRPFQAELESRIYHAWLQQNARVVCAVLPTGGGKTVLFSKILHDYRGASVAVAHRSELVSQISLALARNGVRHRVIGPASLQRACAALHMAEIGRAFYDPGARVAAAGVDTLIRRDVSQDSWFRAVGLVVEDEGHHVLRENKWGQAFDMFPNANGLIVTATPVRADGRGLGRHADGIADALVCGPSMRDLINAGYLTDYRIVAPASDIDYSAVPVGASGELSYPKLRDAVHASNRIVGDVVSSYLKFARGKLGVTFAVDVESATEIAAAYRAAGVPAEIVSAKTPDALRFAILRRFRSRELLQLVNVDLFGEGFDLPAIEVVSMVRKTESYSLYCQQFGRALRLMIPTEWASRWDDTNDEQRRQLIAASAKPKALIIDHVGNVARHGLPDARRAWTLDRRERRARTMNDDVIPLRTCLNESCLAVYERFRKSCPECGQVHVYPERTAPAQVDGDLIELDPAVLAVLRGEIDRIDGAPMVPRSIAGTPAQGALMRVHGERQAAQAVLRAAIALWAGWHRSKGRDDSEIYRRFFFAFGIDVASAMTLNTAGAEALRARVQDDLNSMGVIPV